MKKKIFIFIFICIFSLLNGDILYTEDFSGGTWPSGWSYDAYLVDGDTLTDWSGKPNWRVSNDWSSSININQPAIVFNWKPRIPEPTNNINTEYGLTANSPTIDVGENDAVMVKLDIALKFFNTSDHTNGMLIEANGGDGWLEMLKFEIGPGNFVEIDYRTESFITLITDGALQLRFKAYGTDSYYIDAWVIDNIKVISLPKLSSVHIESNNSTDNQAAIEGDEVTLSFQSEVQLATLPYVQVNGSEASVLPQGDNAYTCNYIVSETDPDGPLTFSIDFTSLDGFIEGSTVKSTTDNSKVLIDRTGPPPFNVVGSPNPVGGNVFPSKWNSTNTSIELEVNVPQDSAVIEFDYFEGNSISFDGFDDYVEINNPEYQFVNQFTIESWIKPSSSSDYEGIFSYGSVNHVESDANGNEISSNSQSGFGFAFFSTGWRFYLQTSTNINWAQLPDASAPTGQWTHLAATYDGTNLKLYKNGSLVNQTDALNGVINLSGAADFNIGYFNHNGIDRYFNGNIDDVRLWNIVRSDLQIKGFKNTTLQGDETGLVGYWKFDESSGSILNDETSNSNNGSINGASLTSLNSPINFSTPIYDNTVIIGSKYQLRSKIGSNDFENFGELQIITESDFQNSSKIISASSTHFSGVSGYQHNENAQISAVLFDQSGNFSLGDTSQTILQIDLVSNNPISVNISSDNSNNSSYAKTGDMVTLTMSYDEDIDSTITTIENNNANDIDLGGEQFKAEYTLTGSEPEGALDFEINAIDYMGNPGSYNLTTNSSNVTYDKTPPTLTFVSISSSNADTAWAKSGDKVWVTFTTSEPISDTLVSILGHNATIETIGNNKFRAEYIPNQSDIEGEINFEIQFSDMAANEGNSVNESTNNTKVIFDRTVPNDFTVSLLTPTGGNQVNGIWNLTNTGMDIIIPIANDTTLINGTVQLYGKVGSNNFEILGSAETISVNEINATKTISILGNLIEGLPGFTEPENIYIKAIIKDRPGNSTEGSQSLTEILIDETPADITPISIISNNGNTALAKVGDTVTVSFTTTEDLTDTTATISGQSAAIAGLGNNQFKAVYIMAEDDPEGIVQFEISFIDIQGNPLTGVTETTDASQVIFDNTKPTLNPITISSDNLCSSGAIAKSGNIISINFTSLESLLSSFAIVMDDTIAITDLGSSQYQIDYILNDFDIEGDVSFLIRVVDLAGNISEDITSTTDNSNVVFDNTKPVITNMHIESNNQAASTIAIEGNTVTLTFESNESLSSASVDILGSTIIPSENGGVYSASYIIQSSDMGDGGFITFSVDFIDCPGNIGLTDSTTTDESFVSIDIGPPSMISVKIFSSNEDSSWAKVDDSVFVYFVANEPLKLDGTPSSSLEIGGNTVDIDVVENTSYQGHYIMTNSDAEGEISLQISFFDIGGQQGNNGSPLQSTTDNSKVKFDKTNPEITSLSFTTNNLYGDSLAKIGDIGTINISLNESIRTISSQLDNINILFDGNGLEYSYAYTFSDTNNNGQINLNILALDSAGNSDDSLLSRIYFDKIPPSVFNLYEGSIDSDYVFTKFPDSLQLAWSVIESGSGSKRSYIGLGSDSGQVDILDWSLASEITQESAKQLSLNNNSKYYGAVYSEDNVGNISDSLWGDGITVDLTPPVPGSVWDGFLNEDIDYVADSTSLYVRWNGFTDNQSIHYYEASIGSLDDTTNIATWQKTTLQDNIQIMDLDLDRGVQYFAYLRAVDSATNISSVIKSDGVEFDNVPPEIKFISPLFDSLQVLSVTNTDQIKIDFNKPILKFGLDIISSQDSAVNYDLTKRDSGITISILDILPSYEMLSVMLDTAIAFNLLNYSDTIIFRSKLWGDLNNDYKITVEDILVFNQAWPYSSTDLGPFSGNPPYIYPSPDNQFNLKDLIAFGKMWMWYYHENNSEVLLINSFDNENLNAIIENNNFRLSIPKSSYAAELTFFNSNESFESLTINNLNTNTFKYRLIDSTLNSISFVIADKNGLDSTLFFSFNNKISEHFTSSIKYKFIDKDANNISDGEGYIITDIIPDKIYIYQNYPNPFNAETLVRYELPKEEDVSINIYDIMGREIYSVSYIKQPAGINNFSWKGNNMVGELVSSGMYFLKIKAGNYHKRMKMILLK